ncbi:glutathione S-transferase family protein [Leptospira levettii]|uniref:Glutathione S-transferase family protein n=1 Tax=Leptospira levettii TaxID=2023178 RepID=A0A5F2D9H8_9LEPT|nr:glutathione S-transferase family protein [Leptospira levettii]PKA23594.1 glutathione S-transferase [Leptospira sp. mixed culture ATI2-C-A1]MCG6147554.1 glutathione S-transferase family protein [Leptospira levettii]MCW7465165.1 glutathione S-transferase family protein [Leptospira levettii]MCW7496005.1 glutathione S-transferase family protein [Leptospira levettii]MCW7509905.1 glutathione S-transferase family protein [Leptospira levettii]
MKIYGDHQSGNCYKIQLLTSLLNIPYEWIEINIKNRETQTESFLQLNPNGKIPILVLDDGRVISESNAILHFLAEGSHLLPNDPFLKAMVLQWQFFEQYSHEPYIAVARFIQHYLGIPEERRLEYESKQLGGHKALKVMEFQLQKSPFLVGDYFTIADISLFAYTHVAHQGGFDLTSYPNIRRWINRIQTMDSFQPMKAD